MNDKEHQQIADLEQRISDLEAEKIFLLDFASMEMIIVKTGGSLKILYRLLLSLKSQVLHIYIFQAGFMVPQN